MTPADPHRVDALTDDDRGTWVVRTENGSAYVIDMDQQTCTRIISHPGDGEHRGPLALRRDSEDVHLILLGACEVGRPAIFFLQLYPGIVTTRTTSDVVSIERA